MRALLALLVLAPLAARADDVAKADELFAQGVKLRASSPEQACAKFEQSLEYNRQAIGTLLNVARCHEERGRTASAVTLFREARDRAREQKLPSHLKEAEARIASLTPQLSYLTLTFATPPAPGTTIVVDDRKIALDDTTKLPVDPGERTIIVAAPGRVAYETKLVIAKQSHEKLAVPALGKAVVSSRRTIGKLTVAGGGAVLVTGVVLGLVANSRYQTQFDTNHCMHVDGVPRPRCDEVGQPAIESARTLGNVGTAVGIVGVAAVGVGLYLWLRAPSEKPARVTLAPHVSRDTAGLALGARF